MSKKKLSKKRAVNKRVVIRSVELKNAPKRRIPRLVLSFCGLKLVEVVFDTILEQPVKDLLSEIVNLAKSIFT